MKYTQCILEKHENESRHTKTCWLPEKYAILNKIVKIKEGKNKWEDGWKIVEAYGSTNESSSILDGGRYWGKLKGVKG